LRVDHRQEFVRWDRQFDGLRDKLLDPLPEFGEFGRGADELAWIPRNIGPEPGPDLDQPRVTQILVDLVDRHGCEADLVREIADRRKPFAIRHAAVRYRVGEQPVELLAHRHGQRLVDAGAIDREHSHSTVSQR
jgi:hypothetical protein